MSISKIDSGGIAASGITADSLNIGQIGGRRNLVINGAMQVAQRGTSVTNVNTTGYKTVDRWQIVNNSGPTFDFEQSTDAPSGFAKSLKLTVNTSDTIGAADYSFYRYSFEGQDVSYLNWGTSDAKTVTLSFWVKSSITGTHGVLLGRQGVAMYGVQYTINSANTWEYKTVTINGPTSGTFATDNSRGFELIFDLGISSTYLQTAGSWSYGTNTFGVTGTVNLSETTGATFQITGVQLEVGSVATPFEHRSYGEELALCQRYYTIVCRQASPAINDSQLVGSMHTSDRCFTKVFFPTYMRALPTITGTNITGNAYRNNTGYAIDALSNVYPDLSSAGLDFGATSNNFVGGSACHIDLLSNALITADAEL